MSDDKLQKSFKHKTHTHMPHICRSRFSYLQNKVNIQYDLVSQQNVLLKRVISEVLCIFGYFSYKTFQIHVS